MTESIKNKNKENERSGNKQGGSAKKSNSMEDKCDLSMDEINQEEALLNNNSSSN